MSQTEIFHNMIGKMMTSTTGKISDDEMCFISDSKTFKFYHSQDCCECVAIEDIAGDLSDLIGYPLLQAEEVNSEDFVDYKFEYEP